MVELSNLAPNKDWAASDDDRNEKEPVNNLAPGETKDT